MSLNQKSSRTKISDREKKSLFDNLSSNKKLDDITALINSSNTNESEIKSLKNEIQKKQDSLGFTPENVSNKQNDLNPSAIKYPTVDAVIGGLNSITDLTIVTRYTEAQRNSLPTPTIGKLIYNTTRDRLEFYEPFWGWHPVALTPSAMRDWGVEFIEDFHAAGLSYVWNGAALNSGNVSSLSGYFGTATINTQTNTNGGYQYRGTTSAIQFGGGQYRWDSRVRIPTNSDGTNTFQFLCGFWDTISGVNQVDGIYFLYDSQGVSTGSAASGNWQIVTASNSVRTFTTTGTVIDNSNLQKLRIDVNADATSVTFYINDVSVGTHTTNIPSGASRLTTSGVYLQKSAGTTARTAQIDYLYLKAKFTTPR